MNSARSSACLIAVVSWAGALPAAVIRGNVIQNQTGRPLARAVITLQPVTGTPGGTQTMRSNSYGAFEFSSLAGGAYVVRASKAGFLTAEYGQKQWNAAGVPVALTDLLRAYRFDGLPPGAYRVLATFEYQAPMWPRWTRPARVRLISKPNRTCSWIWVCTRSVRPGLREAWDKVRFRALSELVAATP